MGFNAFPKSNSPKVNVIARPVFELTYFEVAVQLLVYENPTMLLAPFL